MNPIYQPARVFTAPLHWALLPRTALAEPCRAPPVPPARTTGPSGGDGDGAFTSAVGAWPQCRRQSSCTVSVRELHRPSPGSALSRTKVQWRVLGKTWSDPFGAGAPQRRNALVSTKLKQCFYKRDKKYRLDLLTVKSLSWWKGRVPAACRLTKLTLFSWEQRGEGGWTNPGTRPPVFGNA